MVEAYGCRKQEKLSEMYEEEIRREVNKILCSIKNNVLNDIKFTSDAIGRYSHWGKKPMRSLRDTDEEVELDLRR